MRQVWTSPYNLPIKRWIRSRSVSLTLRGGFPSFWLPLLQVPLSSLMRILGLPLCGEKESNRTIMLCSKTYFCQKYSGQNRPIVDAFFALSLKPFQRTSAHSLADSGCEEQVDERPWIFRQQAKKLWTPGCWLCICFWDLRSLTHQNRCQTWPIKTLVWKDLVVKTNDIGFRNWKAATNSIRFTEQFYNVSLERNRPESHSSCSSTMNGSNIESQLDLQISLPTHGTSTASPTDQTLSWFLISFTMDYSFETPFRDSIR